MSSPDYILNIFDKSFDQSPDIPFQCSSEQNYQDLESNQLPGVNQSYSQIDSILESLPIQNEEQDPDQQMIQNQQDTDCDLYMDFGQTAKQNYQIDDPNQYFLNSSEISHNSQQMIIKEENDEKNQKIRVKIKKLIIKFLKDSGLDLNDIEFDDLKRILIKGFSLENPDIFNISVSSEISSGQIRQWFQKLKQSDCKHANRPQSKSLRESIADYHINVLKLQDEVEYSQLAEYLDDNQVKYSRRTVYRIVKEEMKLGIYCKKSQSINKLKQIFLIINEDQYQEGNLFIKWIED